MNGKEDEQSIEPYDTDTFFKNKKNKLSIVNWWEMDEEF